MTQHAFQQAFNEVSVLPPSFDLAAAMGLAQSIRQFVQAIERGESETALWRARVSQNFRALRQRVDAQAAGRSREDIWPDLQPEIEGAIKLIDDRVVAFVTPLDKDPKFVIPLARLRRASPELARIFRRQFKRAEVMRQKQLATYEDLRDNFLAMAWDYDPDAHGGQSATSAQDLLSALHA